MSSSNKDGKRKKLMELLDKAKTKEMTDEERAEQRISFAYGNVAIHNPLVTKEMVREQANEAVDREITED